MFKILKLKGGKKMNEKELETQIKAVGVLMIFVLGVLTGLISAILNM